MDRSQLRTLLAEVAQGTVTPDEAASRIGAGEAQAYADLGFAKPDLERELRQGVAEVVYGAGKTADQICRIVDALLAGGQARVLVTRMDDAKARALSDHLAVGPSEADPVSVDYRPEAGLALVGGLPPVSGNGYVAVCCAGTSDLYCAEEAALTAQALGSRVVRLYDVGVAGIHRLLAHTQEIQGASAIVAIAGMEGALASVVAGLAPCPVIACPTSVGYGASFGGLAALLSMINSCASGVSVVNIDNGFGAGYQAALIDHAGTCRA